MNDGPSLRGRFGESKVNAAIKIALNGHDYRLIRDVILPTQTGTTQIDHVVISKYGIFVVETKNYSGWIFGGEYQKVWKQTLFNKKTSFQNPLRQNYKHTATIVELLGIDQAKVFSIIVFVGESEFKTPMPDHVTDIAGMVSYINSKRVELFTSDEIGSILNAFDVIRIAPSIENINNHIDSLKSKSSNEKIRNCLEVNFDNNFKQSDKSKRNIIDETFGNTVEHCFRSRAESSKNVSLNISNKISIIKQLLATLMEISNFFVIKINGISSRNVFQKFRYIFYVKTLIAVFAVAIISLLIATTIGNKRQPERSGSRIEIDSSKKDFLSKKTPSNGNYIEQNVRNIYLIELKNGKTIQADTGKINGRTVTLISENGIEMKIDSSQIKSIKKVQL